jgi:hypothetical protein
MAKLRTAFGSEKILNPRYLDAIQSKAKFLFTT